MIAGLATDRIVPYAGIVAGLLFFIVPTIEVFRRPGFDIERHAISMLSLGDGGWIMKSVFLICGLLTLLCAIGLAMEMSHDRTGFIGAVLLGIYGLGLVLAGFFDAPVGMGFPPGTPADQQPVMTAGATLHSVAFMLAFGSLIAACFVLGFYFWNQAQPLWASLSLLTGIALPVLIGLGVSMTIAPGIAFYWAAMLGWLWFAIAVLQLSHAS
jgi:hypothetical protein